MSNQGFGSIGHLAGRFVVALWPGGPKAADEAWARANLNPGEVALWTRMSGPDRRHAVGVARDTLALLAAAHSDEPTPAQRSTPERAITAAALLHDVGKCESRLGTWGRAAATVVAMAVERDTVASWADTRRGWRAEMGRYVTHDQRGATLLRAAGSEALVADWAGEHHLPRERWSVDPTLGDALKAADGD